MIERLLPLPKVIDMTGLKKTKLYEMIRRKEFPAPIKIGRASRWKSGDVEHWYANMPSGGDLIG